MSYDLRPVAALVQRLPKNGKWQNLERNLWLVAMTAVIDLLVEVEDSDARNPRRG